MNPTTARKTPSAPTWRGIAPLLGPAIVAGIAYLDPGNVAANMTAGAQFGYLLVWVVVVANLMAWLVQYLSAKLGIVTGQSLPQILGIRIRSQWGRRAYWAQAEIVAMATDLAEVVGGAIALHLLFGLPLLAGGLITGAVSITILVIHDRRAKKFERVIAAMMLVIAAGFTAGVFVRPPDAAATVAGLIPRFDGSSSVLLAASILGATIMPHAIYAHSALVRDRFNRVAPKPRRSLVLRATRVDVTIALVVAGTVNIVILLIAAAALQGVAGTTTLEGAHAALAATLGPVVATLFAFGLLASGLASTSVGAYAGSEITRGLLRVRIPLVVRRLITLIPALTVLALGFDPTWALVLSQVVLSFGIPFALIPLAWLTSQRSLLGDDANRWFTTVLAVVTTAFLVALNVALISLVLSNP